MAVSTLNGQELEIFRAGNYGAKGKYTPADLQQLASDYNPAQHEAPLVVGHPEMNAPAFGWWKSLRAAGESLFGTPHQVPAEFDDAVAKGRFKKRSVAITRKPDGKLMLRHVGFLGAMVPGVLGMADAKFGDEQFEEFEFSSNPGDAGMAETQQVDKKTITESLREVFADMFGGNKAAATQTVDVDALEERLEAKFSAAADEKVKTLQTEFANYRAQHEKQGQADSVKAVIQRMKDNGQWLPAFNCMGVPELFAAVAEGNTAEFEFADGGKDSAGVATKKKQDALTTLAAVLGGFAKALPTGTVFGDEERKAATTVELPKDAPASADPRSLQFDTDVRAYAKEHSVTYAVAHSRLTAQGKSSAS